MPEDPHLDPGFFHVIAGNFNKILRVLERLTNNSFCKHINFISTHFLIFRFFRHQSVLLQRQVIQGFMRPLAVIFTQLTLRNLSGFIQSPEQIKI